MPCRPVCGPLEARWRLLQGELTIQLIQVWRAVWLSMACCRMHGVLPRWLLHLALACARTTRFVTPATLCRASGLVLEMPPGISSPEAMAGILSSKRRWAAFLLATVVIGPIYEELIFRGFLLPSLGSWLPPGAAVALSSLLFAVWHLNPPAIAINPMAMAVATLAHWWCGCLFGWCYGITGNLLAPIVLHSVFNLMVAARLRWYQCQQNETPPV